MTTFTLKIIKRLNIQNYQINIAWAALIKSRYIYALRYDFMCYNAAQDLTSYST